MCEYVQYVSLSKEGLSGSPSLTFEESAATNPDQPFLVLDHEAQARTDHPLSSFGLWGGGPCGVFFSNVVQRPDQEPLNQNA